MLSKETTDADEPTDSWADGKAPRVLESKIERVGLLDHSYVPSKDAQDSGLDIRS